MNCNQIFKVFREQDQQPDQWILRQAHGPIRTFDRLPMIQKWITEGKVSEQDLISRKNGPWKKIGDIAELKALFKHTPPALGVQKKEPSEHQSTIKSNYPHIENREPTMRHGLLDKRRVDGAKPESEKSTLPPPAMPRNAEDFTSDAPTPLATPKDPRRPSYDDLKRTRFDAGATIPRADPTYDPDKTVRRANPFIAESAKSDPPAETKTEPPKANPIAPKSDPDFSQVPAHTQNEKWNQGASIGVSEPAWTEKTGGVPMYTDAGESLPPPRKTAGKWITLAIVGLVAVTAVTVFVVLPDIGGSLLSEFDSIASEPKENRFKKFFDRGQESFLLDSDSAFLQADREFQKVLALDENNPDALAALAKLYAVWAQYLRDAKIDAIADAGPTPDEPALKEQQRLSREFKEKLDEASGWADRAIQADGANRSAFLALADIFRLKGDLTSATTYLKKATDLQVDSESEYVSVLIDMEKGDPVSRLIPRLDELVSSKPMIRGIYRKARLLAVDGEGPKAIAALDRLLTLNSNHDRAKALRDRILSEQPVWILENGNENASATAGAKAATAGKGPQSAKASKKATDTKSDESASGSGERGGDHNIRGMLAKAKRLQKRGKTQEAKSYYDRVLETAPNDLDALAGVGYYHLDRGASGQAIASFRRCLKISPNYGPALIGLAETYKSMGQPGQALNFYRQYLSANPGGRQADLARRNISRLAAPDTTESTSEKDMAPSPGSEGATEATDTPTPPPAEDEEATKENAPEMDEMDESPPAKDEEKKEITIIERDENDAPASE